ncbi:MAG: aminotransferase class V-fold PLP-dependent enzyme, partial [Clostridiales bacterium]|nr:aminotransferase class V-fold PLP-dependent enzyme [Clostridiales bacterium]
MAHEKKREEGVLLPVYLDHAATTRVCPEAARAALSAMTGTYGNPSSRHAAGALAAERLQADRAAVAAALGCPAQAVYFTSGGTESNNWAIAIAGWAGRRTGRHVVTTAIEHTAVLEALKAPGRDYEVTYVKPDRSGHVPAEVLRAALRPDTILVSVMLVNNELGTVQPVAEAARAVREAGSPALVHTDAVQAFC